LPTHLREFEEEIIMGPFEVAVAALLVGIPGIIGFTALIMRFHLKKKELEMRGGDPELGPVVDELRDDLNDTRARLADMEERLDFAERLLTAGRASQEDRSG